MASAKAAGSSAAAGAESLQRRYQRNVSALAKSIV